MVIVLRNSSLPLFWLGKFSLVRSGFLLFFHSSKTHYTRRSTGPDAWTLLALSVCYSSVLQIIILLSLCKSNTVLSKRTSSSKAVIHKILHTEVKNHLNVALCRVKLCPAVEGKKHQTANRITVWEVSAWEFSLWLMLNFYLYKENLYWTI